MAALPYMQLYVADYLADTMHLTAEEHGAYLLLIMNYWQTGKALKNDPERLATIARTSNERWPQVASELKEFFNITSTEWQHARIEEDLSVVLARSEKAKNAGKASAAAKKAKKARSDKENQLQGNDRSTGVATPAQLGGNHTDTDTDTDTEASLEPLRGSEPCGSMQQTLATLPTKPSKQKTPPCPHREIVAMYHELLPEAPVVNMKLWKGERSKLLAARWKQDKAHQSLDFWREVVFQNVIDSDFLMGRTEGVNGPFRNLSMKWIILPTNFVKIVEHEYDNREPVQRGAYK